MTKYVFDWESETRGKRRAEIKETIQKASIYLAYYEIFKRPEN